MYKYFFPGKNADILRNPLSNDILVANKYLHKFRIYVTVDLWKRSLQCSFLLFYSYIYISYALNAV